MTEADISAFNVTVKKAASVLSIKALCPPHLKDRAVKPATFVRIYICPLHTGERARERAYRLRREGHGSVLRTAPFGMHDPVGFKTLHGLEARMKLVYSCRPWGLHNRCALEPCNHESCKFDELFMPAWRLNRSTSDSSMAFASTKGAPRAPNSSGCPKVHQVYHPAVSASAPSRPRSR